MNEWWTAGKFYSRRGAEAKKETIMKIKQLMFLAILYVVTLAAACGINSVTKQELENVKAGDVLVYRYQKDGKSWFYADKITRVEADRILYNPSKSESTSGTDERLKEFQTESEASMPKADLYKYETEQGEDEKLIMWIQ